MIYWYWSRSRSITAFLFLWCVGLCHMARQTAFYLAAMVASVTNNVELSSSPCVFFYHYFFFVIDWNYSPLLLYCCYLAADAGKGGVAVPRDVRQHASSLRAPHGRKRLPSNAENLRRGIVFCMFGIFSAGAVSCSPCYLYYIFFRRRARYGTFWVC